MINLTAKLREGSRIIAWDGDYKRYFTIAVTKVNSTSCQGLDTNFEKHTGLKYKFCWWPEDFRKEKPKDFARLFPAPVAESHAKEQETPDIAPPPDDSTANLCGGKPERWNPQDFGEVKRKAEPDGQLTIFWDSPEPPDPDDCPEPGSYERAWEKWEAQAAGIEPIEPTDPRKIWERYTNSISAQASARDLPQLRNLKMLQPGEVLNPDCGEIWSGLPPSWTSTTDERSASEFLAATETTAIVEKPSVTPSIQESHSAPSKESSICNQSQKKQASGWLEQRTERRKLADGSSVVYPKVEGVRDRAIPEHWYWQYCYEEQVSKGKFRKVNTRVSPAKAMAIATAIKREWTVEKILSYLKGEL